MSETDNSDTQAGPAAAMPVESYSDELKAEFLLNNAADEPDYAWALREMRKLGLGPEKVPHERPRAE